VLSKRFERKSYWLKGRKGHKKAKVDDGGLFPEKQK
jgi:hypothetical protein